ncbi:MAG TPA: hypothetical protein DGG95_13590 [Cytophagales bacterium]|jgi:hypothetical protein|nr:hypothetical protein [Cytophagales bacterium]
MLGRESSIKNEPEYIIWYDYLVLFFDTFDKERLVFRCYWQSGGVMDQDESLLYIMKKFRSIYIDLLRDEDVKGNKCQKLN